MQLQDAQLTTLPEEIERLESTIARLQAKQAVRNPGGPAQNMGLPATLALLSEMDAEAEQLDAQISALQMAVPKTARELERMRSELRPLEIQKQQAIAAAQDAMRRKKQGEKGIGDDLEIKGRWYTGSHKVMTSILGAEA